MTTLTATDAKDTAADVVQLTDAPPRRGKKHVKPTASTPVRPDQGHFDPPPRDGGGNRVVLPTGGGKPRKISLNLRPLAAKALDWIVGKTGNDATVTVNRCITIVHWLMEEQEKGSVFMIIHPGGATSQLPPLERL